MSVQQRRHHILNVWQNVPYEVKTQYWYYEKQNVGNQIRNFQQWERVSPLLFSSKFFHLYFRKKGRCCLILFLTLMVCCGQLEFEVWCVYEDIMFDHQTRTLHDMIRQLNYHIFSFMRSHGNYALSNNIFTILFIL